MFEGEQQPHRPNRAPCQWLQHSLTSPLPLCRVPLQHKMAVEATQKLVNERNGLINTVKTLQREVKKLEVFKRNLMNSLRDDDDVSGPNDSPELPLQTHRRFH